MKSRSVSFLKEHYLFFRFLRTHPKLARLRFEEWVYLAGREWEFCSHSHRIIIELLDGDGKKSACSGKTPPYQVLRYEVSMWQEFPEIVAEDIESISSYVRRPAAPAS